MQGYFWGKRFDCCSMRLKPQVISAFAATFLEKMTICGRKLRAIREIRWLEEGAREVLTSIVSTSEPLKRQQERSGFLMAGDRHGCSAANHPGLRRRHGYPRRPRFHRPAGIAECQGACRNPFTFNPGPAGWRPWMSALPCGQQLKFALLWIVGH